MSAIIFDGRKFAAEIENRLKMGRKLKLVTILDPKHKPSVVYTNIKAKMAQRLGVDFEKIEDLDNIKEQISKLNDDLDVDGMIIQLPLTGDKKQDQKLCNLITPEKDVDGLGEKSLFLPATVKGVLVILNEVKDPDNSGFFAKAQNDNRVLVVGNQGLVGARVEKELKKDPRFDVYGMDKEDFDPSTLLKADIVISATGQAGLIKPEMVKDGVIVIDVGYPAGDFAQEVVDKASFMTPVPGGVGPVTVVMLFKNLIDLVI